MLPSDRASTSVVAGVTPTTPLLNDLHDFLRGGVAIQDTSQGLTSQVWECFYRGVDVVAQPTTGPEVVLFSMAGITALSMAFDQSMRPVVAFEREGQLWLWWWDTLTNSRRTDLFGEGRCPRLLLDDPRASMIATSDVIFAYIVDTRLCFRQQRDRFATERLLRTNVSSLSRLKNVQMTSKMRLKFELV